MTGRGMGGRYTTLFRSTDVYMVMICYYWIILTVPRHLGQPRQSSNLHHWPIPPTSPVVPKAGRESRVVFPNPLSPPQKDVSNVETIIGWGRWPEGGWGVWGNMILDSLPASGTTGDVGGIGQWCRLLICLGCPRCLGTVRIIQC